MTSTPRKTPPEPAPPVAARIPTVTVVHGESRVDEYAWLRQRDAPEVRRYLEAENAYTEEVMRPTQALRSRLYEEMLARIKETDEEVPYRRGEYYYYSRTEQGRQYPMYCRRRGATDGPVETTLDLNRLAEGKSFMALGAYRPSDDARRLAYATDDTGFRQYTLFVKDLGTDEILETVAEKVGSVAWAADGETLFYTVEEEGTKRQYRLYRHRLGTGVHDLVYEEKDAAFNVDVYRTRSLAYLVLVAGSLTTSEARVLPAREPLGEWRLVAPRVSQQEYEVDHRGDVFYVRTNDAGRNFRLVEAPCATPGREHWREVVPHRDEVMLEGADCFSDHLVLFEREAGLPQMRVTDLRTGASHRIAFPEAAYSAFPETNAEFATRRFRYGYQSLVTPPSVFEYDMDERTVTLLKEQPVLGGYDRGRYQTGRVFATAEDGVRVPISIVRRRGLPRDGRGPLHLVGYGSYGIPLPVTFSSNRISLLDRGVTVALAHVRGGGEMGKRWHDEGRLLKKRNTFTDFVAAAEHLLAEGYGRRDLLVIEGRSAGGLLMGAVANMRPDLCRAVVAQVPFVDVINSMLDESLPLTAGEFEEWGNPKEKAAYDYIRSYCPYSNLERKAYPAMLVKTSFHDSQVMYWEPAKYVARLRALKTDSQPLLLETNMAAGHGGASGRYDYLREVAFDYAFLLWQMGRAGPEAG
jgi:oligopeptidase B